MQAIKGLFCIFLLLTCVKIYSVDLRCCFCFLLKRTKENPKAACKRRSLYEPLHDGAQELQFMPKSNVLTVLPQEDRDAANGTPWTKGQFFSDTKPKYQPFQDQESRTPIPRAETIQENLDSAGILKAPSNSFIDPTWDRVDSVSSKNSLVDKIVHSSETFRHCDSSDFLEALVDQETQTERKKVSFR